MVQVRCIHKYCMWFPIHLFDYLHGLFIITSLNCSAYNSTNATPRSSAKVQAPN